MENLLHSGYDTLLLFRGTVKQIQRFAFTLSERKKKSSSFFFLLSLRLLLCLLQLFQTITNLYVEICACALFLTLCSVLATYSWALQYNVYCSWKLGKCVYPPILLRLRILCHLSVSLETHTFLVADETWQAKFIITGDQIQALVLCESKWGHKSGRTRLNTAQQRCKLNSLSGQRRGSKFGKS